MPQILLLAAGKSSRTWPISEKIFFEIGGKTIFERQIETILAAKIQKIVVVGNAENIEKIKVLSKKFSADFNFAVQKNLDDGIAGGILAAEKKIDDKKPVFVACSNDIVEKSAFEMPQIAAKKSNSEIFLVGKKVENYFPGGYLKLFRGKNGENKNRIQKIVEKPKIGEEPSDLVTLLIHFWKNPKMLFSALKSRKQNENYEEILQKCFDHGVLAEVVKYDDFWSAIKYPWHFLAVGKHFLEKISKTEIHPTAKIGKMASIGDRVVIGKNAKILDGAVIAGPSFIGEKVVVGNGALVRESAVEKNSVVGHGTEIARSFLQKNCWTHQNFVGDSVFAENVSLGAGTRTGNLRLEEGEILSEIKEQKISSNLKKMGTFCGKNVRVGVNTSFMPGVKIGAGTFLGAGLIIDRDIPENRFVKGIFKLSERENKFLVKKRKNF